MAMVVSEGRVYVLRCGVVVKTLPYREDSLETKVLFVPANPSMLEICGRGNGRMMTQAEAIREWFDARSVGGVGYWIHKHNGRCDMDQPGHPLNVVRELEP